MAQELASGLFALCGVLIGGAVTTATGLVAERRQRQRMAMTNARLLEEDVGNARRAVRRAVDGRNLAPLTRRISSVDEYQARRDQLAATLEPGEWAAVSRAFRNLGELLVFVSDRPTGDVDDEGITWLDVLGGELDAAALVLSDVADTPFASQTRA